MLLVAASLDCAKAAGEELSDTLEVRRFSIERRSTVRGERGYKGILAADGEGARLAIYWRDPMPFSEATDYLACSDMIWRKGKVFVWVYQGIAVDYLELDVQPLDGQCSVSGDDQLQDLLSCILGVASLALSAGLDPEARDLSMSRFFREPVGQTRHASSIAVTDANGRKRSSCLPSGVLDLLHEPPAGRTFERVEHADGAVTWVMRRGTAGSPLVRVEVGAELDIGRCDTENMFDPNSLGKWDMVPKYHWMYWGFHKRWLNLLKRKVDRSAGPLLVSDIDDALRSMPTEVRLQARCLQTQVAAFSDDAVAVSRAAGEYLTELACYEATVSDVIAELARVVTEVRRHHATDPEATAFVDPLVDKICQQSVCENPHFVQDIVGELCANQAYGIARRLMSNVQKRRWIGEAVVAELSEEIELSSAVVTREKLDPSRLTASAFQLVAQLDAPPPKGVLTWEAVRVALSNGMVHRFADAPEKKEQFVEDTLNLVSLGAGKGPFRGDAEALTDSVARLDETYPADKVTLQEMRDTLAALLVVSFYDTSTSEDRDRLAAQLHDIFDSTWTELLKCLKELGLDNQLEAGASQTIEKHMKEVKSYISDPLWPMYKHPLSDNEITRITSSALLELKAMREVLRDAARRHHDRQRLSVSGLDNLVATIIETPLFEIRYPKVGGAHFWRDGRVFRVFVPPDMYATQEQLRSVVRILAYGFFLGHEPAYEHDSPSR